MKKNRIKKFHLATVVNFIFFILFVIILLSSLLWLYNSSIKSIQNETDNYLNQSGKIVEIVLNSYANGLADFTRHISHEYEFELSRIKNDDSTEIYLRNMFNSNIDNKLDFLFLNLRDGKTINPSVSIYDIKGIVNDVIKDKTVQGIFYKEIKIDNETYATIITKEEIVDSNSGRYIGDLYAGIILNDNFSIINEMYSLLKVKALALIVQDKPITLYGSTNIDINNKIKNSKIDEIYVMDSSIIKKSQLKIKGENSSLELILISTNNVFNKFESDFLFKVFLLMFFVVILFSITYKFIKKLIEIPLERLLYYAAKITDNHKGEEYEESRIEEFNKLGYDFEKLISRIKKMNDVLADLVHRRTQQLALKTDKVTDLLNNAGQGFLSIGKDFLINDEYSTECENILGKELKNKDISFLLFDKNENSIEFFKETIIDALNEKNELTSSLILSLLPKELIINKRAIQVEYKVLPHEKMMLILTNVTDKKKLETKIKNEQQTLKMIVMIVSDSVQFYETKENYEQFCADSILYINHKNQPKENANTLYILIHTFKGLFAQMYMKNTVKKLHNYESKLMEFIDGNIEDNGDLEDIINCFDLSSCMHEDLTLITKSLGEKFLYENSYIKINEKLITKLEEKLSLFCTFSSNNKEECSLIIKDIQKLKNRSLKYYLSVYPKICQHLCLSLNKNIYPFEIIGENDIYIPDSFKPFINSLIHVFRNCCDHGIEKKEERILLDKNEVGTISCIFKKKDNYLRIEILDDGCGIDANKIKEKIIQYKLNSKEKAQLLNKEEILEFIFDAHFSTNDTITQLSGRGIGLAAVKTELEKLNGTVEIDTEINQGTSFVFRLPLIGF